MSDKDGALRSAESCREFADALEVKGFTREEAVAIVAAWMSRPLPVVMDAAAMNAVMQNFAESITGRHG